MPCILEFQSAQSLFSLIDAINVTISSIYLARNPLNRNANMARNSIIVQFLLALALAACTHGCRCPIPPPFEKAVEAAADGPAPYFVAKVISENRPTNINAQVTYKLSVATACGKTRTQLLTTCGNGACCGVELTVGKKYALPLLKSGKKSSLNSCQRYAAYDSLTDFEKGLVAVCEKCKTPCVCVQSPCPCDTEPRCKPGFKCVDEMCVPIIPISSCSKCKPGTKCVNGKCVPITCPKPCPFGTVCQFGKCVPDAASCAAVLCPVGTICKNGKCIREDTIKCRPICKCLGCPCSFEPPCPKGYKCVGAICVKCGPNELELGGRCVPYKCSPPCKALFCRPCERGFVCSPKGQCVLPKQQLKSEVAE